MKKKIIIAVAVIVILAAGGTFYLNHKVSSAVKDGKIIKGVSCEGISIGGMTRSEAKDAIESHMKEIHQEKITLYVDDERSSAKIEDLGAFAEADKTVEEAYALGRSGSIFTKYSDVKEKKHKLPVYRKYDKAKFEKNVKKATKKIVSEPRNASVKRKDGKFVVIKEKTGYTLKMHGFLEQQTIMVTEKQFPIMEILLTIMQKQNIHQKIWQRSKMYLELIQPNTVDLHMVVK